MNYYKILGLSKNSSKKDIKNAYHKLAQKYHPDRESGSKEKFLKVQEAYEFLIKNHEALPSEDLYSKEDSFNKVFNELFKTMQSNKNKVQKVINLNITLKEALEGFDRNLKINFEIPCVKCNAFTKNICKSCKGYGYIKEPHVSSFHFDPISHNNQSFYYKSYYKDIDLVVKISIESTNFYKVKGKDIITYYNLSIFESILGGEHEVLTPVGLQKINLPEGNIADFNYFIENKGLADGGNLYIKFIINPIKNLTKCQRQLLNRIIDEEEQKDKTKN
jgi:DnaJ-class molecular chaperone